MTSCSFPERDYTDVSQELYITDRFKFVFTFYDHHMCGPEMRDVFLYDLKTGHQCQILLDSPATSQVAGFTKNHCKQITMKILKRDENKKLSHDQLLCCLATIMRVPEVQEKKSHWSTVELDRLFPAPKKHEETGITSIVKDEDWREEWLTDTARMSREGQVFQAFVSELDS